MCPTAGASGARLHKKVLGASSLGPPAPLSKEELEAMAAVLVASGHYRIQRLLPALPLSRRLWAPSSKSYVASTPKTTGLDHQSDEIIELAMVPFLYGAEGQAYEVMEPFQRFHQPNRPISARRLPD